MEFSCLCHFLFFSVTFEFHGCSAHLFLVSLELTKQMLASYLQNTSCHLTSHSTWRQLPQFWSRFHFPLSWMNEGIKVKKRKCYISHYVLGYNTFRALHVKKRCSWEFFCSLVQVLESIARFWGRNFCKLSLDLIFVSHVSFYEGRCLLMGFQSENHLWEHTLPQLKTTIIVLQNIAFRCCFFGIFYLLGL